MVNIKVLTAAATLVFMGIATPVAAEEMAPSVGSDPNAVHHDRGEADDATGDDRMNSQEKAEVDASATGADSAVHSSAYKKTYPDEPEVSELEE